MTNKELDKQIRVSVKYLIQFSKGLDRTFKPESAAEFDKQLNTLVGELSIFSNVIKEYVLESNWKAAGSYTALVGRLTIIAMLNEYPLLDTQKNKNFIQLELYSIFSYLQSIRTQNDIVGLIDSVRSITFHIFEIKHYLRFENKNE